ncbi:MAG: hypothetical protein WC600_17300 [Desulfobaccales bacterium]
MGDYAGVLIYLRGVLRGVLFQGMTFYAYPGHAALINSACFKGSQGRATAPKAGALTRLRYVPKAVFNNLALSSEFCKRFSCQQTGKSAFLEIHPRSSLIFQALFLR